MRELSNTSWSSLQEQFQFYSTYVYHTIFRQLFCHQSQARIEPAVDFIFLILMFAPFSRPHFKQLENPMEHGATLKESGHYMFGVDTDFSNVIFLIKNYN